MDLVVEVPRFSFVKWGADGGVDFVSPVPCPFNYGSVPDTAGPDGDPADVLWLGPRQVRGTRARRPVVAVVRFVDQGLPDDKWVCADGPLRRRDRLALAAFFRAYAFAKRVTGRGPSRFGGVEAAQSTDTGSSGRYSSG